LVIREKRTRIIYNLITVVILVIFLFPIYWMVNTSFKGVEEIFARTPTFFPQAPTLDGYIHQLFVRGTVPFWRTFLNSLIIASLATIISAGLATFAAYGLARFKLSLTKAILFIVLLAQMMPAVLFLSPMFISFQRLNVLDTYLAPVMFTALQSIPFCIIVMRPYFLNIPGELEEAARIDGCGKLKTFFRVMAPISYPGIIVSAAFTFLWGWGDLMGSLTFIRSESMLPLTVNMFNAIGEDGIRWNSLMAFAVILTVPVVVIFVGLQKYLISGMTSGAVKG